ncbi:MAG TPA: zinc metallopeptidase [Anaerolineales bacterium]|nr:zinc metallopeptidase [Anaerolineales bacterium]
MPLFSFDYLVFMLPAFILVVLAQWWVNSTMRRWGQVRSTGGMTGTEVAKRLLRYGGMGDVSLEGVPGNLSDHYDPQSRTLRLSPGVAQGQSVAALAIAAHEIGHAEQDHQGYLPLQFRAALVPAVNIGSRLGWMLILLGLALRTALGTQLAWIGVASFSLGALFSLATLPVELNASSRARALLTQAGLVQSSEEQRGVNQVLTAAAFTYVAALAAAVLQLLYWISLVSGSGGRRRS